MSTFSGDGWSVELPERWIGVTYPGHVELLWEDNASSLRVFTELQGSPVVRSDLAAFVADYVEVPGPPQAVECGEFKGLAFRSVFEGRFVRNWVLHRGRTLLAVVHTCPETEAGGYDAEVDGVLQSLRSSDADHAV